ncbi:hypothetical protein A9R05_28055 [Burkholderia sp. KK1]|uniref:Rhodanese domain-containing protein n=1 Tax=Caballeronia cordobensis TaxID=1353886 RepID=A0A158GPF1_CABCO|nr:MULTISPECIES: hypothetical protein [Caballeronia]AQH02765.1 hypothetical protein A9R05_28055 [Burkholderia sp. KK1]MCE4573524.1 hypothetical protein [Caballeronia sp. CLC5]BBQ00367.1 hypothetical protein BSFA1_54950 [Burkholderia sp. SFA1]SAL33701.1 hypothetical protein AWB70_02258 [Caballeronia cordobensis]
MPRFVSAAQLRTLIAQRSELAVLDVREEGELVEQVERDAIASIDVIDFGTATARRSRERLAASSGPRA